IGVIAIDASYTPVQRVGYTVENVRVGQMTNFDKLTLDIQTDGGLTPQQAVQQASQILIDHFKVIVGNEQAQVSQIKKEESIEEETVSQETVVDKAVKKRGRPKKEV
ncbi:MAG: hypothetical protein ACOZAJ_04160, partial [Patescibacteria group bacterium]